MEAVVTVISVLFVLNGVITVTTVITVLSSHYSHYCTFCNEWNGKFVPIGPNLLKIQSMQNHKGTLKLTTIA